MAAYELLLLNTAIPQIQAAQSGDTYLVPRDIAFSAALTLSAGTANGVPYLNASKVLTTGSALQFNGTDVGLGGSPVSSGVPGQPQLSVLSATSGRSGVINWQDTGNNNVATSYFFGSVFYLGPTTNHPFAFYANGSEQMRLTSTGLGIGTSSPQAKLHVAQTSSAILFSQDSTTATIVGTNAAGTASQGLFLRGFPLTFTGNGGGGAEQMRLDSSGNLKLGGTADRATTVGTNHLNIFNGTAPVGTLADGISIYSAAGEAYVMDAAGNATLFSPHDAETNEWIFKSKHTPTGKVLKIDVERLLKFVNDHFGLDAVHEFVEE